MAVKRLLVIVLVAMVALLAALAWFRAREAAAFSQPYRVHTVAGTNYVIQLTSATVGRDGTNYLVIVAARLENPNPGEVVLRREWFVLTDRGRDSYRPSTNGTQSALIRLPARGVLERELFTYALPGGALEGALALLVRNQCFVPVKSPRPYQPSLRDGEFVTFHRRDW